MQEELKFVEYLIGAVATLFTIIHMVYIKHKKTDDYRIVIFSTKRFYFKLIIAVAILLIFLYLTFFCAYGKGESNYFAYLLIIMLCFSRISWIYEFSEEGIKLNNEKLIKWEDITDWKWLEEGNNVLFIDYNKGYIKIETGKKKELVSEFLQNIVI